VIDDIGATKQQLESDENLYNRMQEASCPGYPIERNTEPLVCDGRVVQGLQMATYQS
jgi:hypothetical protein